MIELFRLAAELQDLCHRQRWQFCFIGGIAVQRWGSPRVTQDVDMTLLTGFGADQLPAAAVYTTDLRGG
jgi:hypothetical protein